VLGRQHHRHRSHPATLGDELGVADERRIGPSWVASLFIGIVTIAATSPASAASVARITEVRAAAPAAASS
jgi:hypothetical protein